MNCPRLPWAELILVSKGEIIYGNLEGKMLEGGSKIGRNQNKEQGPEHRKGQPLEGRRLGLLAMWGRGEDGRKWEKWRHSLWWPQDNDKVCREVVGLERLCRF